MQMQKMHINEKLIGFFSSSYPDRITRAGKNIRDELVCILTQYRGV